MLNLLDKAKHIVFEDEGGPNEPSVKPETQKTNQTTGAAPTQVAPVLHPGGGSSSDVYERLKAATDFSKTNAGLQLHKYLDPLATIPDSTMSPQVKFHAAFVQANAQLGLTVQEALSSFDDMRNILNSQKAKFDQGSQGYTDNYITKREKRLEEIRAQLDDLTKQQADTAADLAGSKAHLAELQAGFTAAYNQRNAEIDEEQVKYAALLKG